MTGTVGVGKQPCDAILRQTAAFIAEAVLILVDSVVAGVFAERIDARLVIT